jgi:hypothetical protein
MRRADQSPGRADVRRGVVAAAWLLAILPGCVPPTHRPSPDPVVAEVDFDQDAVWAEVRQTQADRLDALGGFSSAGTTTIRFTDAEGAARAEQVELRIWRIAPARAAVRLSKVGASFLLAGWNADRWWVLDESGDEKVLRVRRLAGVRPENGVEAMLAPPVFLALMGLLPWPDAAPEVLEAIRVDNEGRVVGVRFELPQMAWPTTDGLDLEIPGRMQVEVDRFGHGPSRIRLLAADGEVLVESALSRQESVETRGLPPGAWPTLPHRVLVRRWNGDEISISLDVPLAGGEISDRLFDLESLRKRHPDAIVDDPEIGS